MWYSPTQGDKLNNSAPFATVAFAGHVLTGGAYCVCDNPNSHMLGASVPGDDSAHHDENIIQDDLGIELGIALMALMLWLKLRA
jgi:hypothetical protein